MTGHVAQVFLSDDDWARVLREIHRALRPGGTLAFETRDPRAAAWEGWTREGTLREVPGDDGPVQVWHETRRVALPLVTYATFARSTRTDETSESLDTLAFRDEPTLRATLSSAGFEVHALFGDWQRGEVVPGATRELIVVARRRR